MPLFENLTEAFIVRIWLERRELQDASPEWRGVVEHVASGQRRYVRNPNDIMPFILQCLQKLGWPEQSQQS